VSSSHFLVGRTPQNARPTRRAISVAAPIQAKLRIGAVDDPLEHEADRVADAVMRGEAAGSLGRAPGTPQRMCSGCAGEPQEDDLVQRKCAACEASGADQDQAGEAAAAVGGGGAPLTPELRRYFEPRFGRDFSDVRLHVGAQPAAAASAIGAHAYTLGSDVAFATGEFAPSAPAGRRLIAHELAHVVQQRGSGDGAIRRTVAATSVCPANTHNAGATPLDDLRAADEEARRMALGASNVLALEALTFRDPAFGQSYVSAAYRRRFHDAGPATGSGSAGRFRNRFDGSTFASQPEAAAAEMLSLSARFKGQRDFLAGNIRYRCPGGGVTLTIGGCEDRCAANDFAWSCPTTHARTIAICPGFWGLSAAQRAAVIVHESVHMRLHVRGENSASLAQRGTNAECYASLILDLYGEGVAASIAAQFTTVDPSCPP
jgi:hypothetical protein